ncbi:heme-degrading domain-containing protein [Geminicoccus harenae]|uniref:heme-degrading domain-containing protein n=1 Tax=Geminicoccus harenae TaxID=2498453 RepID=UPI00168BAFF9|nr:heme-degrading domain-containing protein [Geminicoccus harenae]
MSDHEDLEELLAEEERLQFDRFDNDTALELGQFILTAARRRGLGVTIDITRGEQQIFHAALAGTSADNDAWVQRKARAVRRFGHSSWYLGCLSRAKGYDFHQKFLLDPAEFAPAGGSYPIAVRGTGLVGTVTVSGLPQKEDHIFLTEVLAEFLARAG